MIRNHPMGSIHHTSNPESRSTKDTNFTQCVDVWESQIYEVWSLGLDGIFRKVHPAARVEVVTGIVGEFTTDCLPENGRRILIIRQLSINDSVQFLGIPDFVWGSGL